MNRLILNYFWKPASFILLFFLAVQLLVISPFFIFLLVLAKGASIAAPDVFTSSIIRHRPGGKQRRILLCVDATSFQSVNWATRDFIIKAEDHLIVTHISEPRESMQLPVDTFEFDQTNIDSKDFLIPQYLSEFCHWLGRNKVSYEGLIMKPSKGHNVAESIIKLGQDMKVDCILASASERTGTTDIGNVAFQIAMRSPITTIIVNHLIQGCWRRHRVDMPIQSENCPIKVANNSEQTPPDLKPCCACPETRKLRDDCVFLRGEDSCTEFIEKHKECLRSYGFKIE